MRPPLCLGLGLFLFLAACSPAESPQRNADWTALDIRSEEEGAVQKSYWQKERHGSTYFSDPSGKLNRIEGHFRGNLFYAAECTDSGTLHELAGAPIQTFGEARTLRYVQDPIELEIACVDFPDSREELEMCLVGPDQSWAGCEALAFEPNGIARAVFSWDQPGYHQIGFRLRVQGRFELVHERVSGYFLEAQPAEQISM